MAGLGGQGEAWRGEARRSRHGGAWPGLVGFGGQGVARFGEVWYGEAVGAWLGAARRGKAWQGGRGEAWLGMARPGGRVVFWIVAASLAFTIK